MSLDSYTADEVLRYAGLANSSRVRALPDSHRRRFVASVREAMAEELEMRPRRRPLRANVRAAVWEDCRRSEENPEGIPPIVLWLLMQILPRLIAWLWERRHRGGPRMEALGHVPTLPVILT